MTSRATQKEGEFTLRQRLALWLISWAGYLAIRLICATVRYSISSEEGDARQIAVRGPLVAPFWHRCVFSATYFFRDRGIAVVTSRSFDGEYIARIIEKFGFVAVRGSSSRGGAGALLGMHDVIDQGGVAAFTIDGPRGPRYVAKPGPVLLAKNTGAPIRCFYVAVDRAWVLNSWDAFMIPKPFARAHVRWSREIAVPADTDAQQMKVFHDEMQSALERMRLEAERAVERR